MKTRAILALTAVAGIAAGASAQAVTTGSNVTYALSWTEVNGNGNGILEEGESALITMDTSFTNKGQSASFTPPIGAFTSGTILGFGTGFLDLNGSGGTAGEFNYSNPLANAQGTSGFGVRGPWRIAGNASNGTPNAAGDGMINIQPGQFVPTPGSVNSQNPITNMYRLLWTPSNYGDRTVTFQLAKAAIASVTGASVYMDLDGSVGSSVYVAESNISYGSVNIPVIPAPASLALLGLGGLVAARRRR